MIARAHAVDESIRVQRWQRWWLYLATAALVASGVIWLWVHYLAARPAGEFGSSTHPWEPWTMRVHGLAVMVGLFFFGSLLRTHILKAWTLRRNRYLGGFMLAALGLLAVSGYLLYYSSGENLRSVLSVSHWLGGLVLAGAFPLHVYYGRRSRRRRDKISSRRAHEGATFANRHDRRHEIRSDDYLAREI